MAKRSQWGEILKRRERLRSRRSQPRLQGPAGFGLSFTHNRAEEGKPFAPVSPPTAFFLRRFSSFWDALKAWRADTPPEKSRLAHEKAEQAWAMVPHHREAISRILSALGSRRDDYAAAEKALMNWCHTTARKAGLTRGEPLRPDHPDPSMRVAWGLRFWVHPLLWAYADPKKFFRDVAPKIDSNRLFDPKEIGPFGDDGSFRFSKLGRTLYTWGFGALLNPAVRRAFDAAAKNPEKLVEILAEAEGRGCYNEGPPLGATKGKRKTGRPCKPDKQLRAGSLEKRINRSGIHKRK